jgi:AraC-like DNA-binding protein
MTELPFEEVNQRNVECRRYLRVTFGAVQRRLRLSPRTVTQQFRDVNNTDNIRWFTALQLEIKLMTGGRKTMYVELPSTFREAT